MDDCSGWEIGIHLMYATDIDKIKAAMRKHVLVYKVYAMFEYV